jgi:hypothetical protein
MTSHEDIVPLENSTFADMPPLENSSGATEADGSPLTEDARLTAEVLGVSGNAAAIRRSDEPTAGVFSSLYVAAYTEQQDGEEIAPLVDNISTVPGSAVAPDTLVSLQDDWEAQQIPSPPFKTDGRGNVVFANPEAAHEYTQSRRRRHGRA